MEAFRPPLRRCALREPDYFACIEKGMPLRYHPACARLSSAETR